MSVDYHRTVPAPAHGGRFNPDPPHMDVIHSTEGPMSRGNALALAQNWFGRPESQGGAGTSTTGIFDPGDSVRMLDEHTIPFHVGPDGNPVSSGDEHCGSVNLTTAQWLSADGREMLDRSAKVKAQRAIARHWTLAECRWLTLSQVAARNVNGFCTHNDIRLALGGTTHSDPGRNFPYSWYMGRIRFWYQTLTGTLPAEDDVPNTAQEIKSWVNQCIEDKFGLIDGTNFALGVFGQNNNSQAFNLLLNTQNPNSLVSRLERVETMHEDMNTKLDNILALLSTQPPQ